MISPVLLFLVFQLKLSSLLFFTISCMYQNSCKMIQHVQISFVMYQICCNMFILMTN